MTLFADLGISDAVALAIVGIVAMTVKEFFDRARARDARADAREAAAQVKEVKTTLADTTTLTSNKLDTAIADIHKVELATNSLTDRLVETTRTEAHAAGIKEEQNRIKP